MFGNNDKITARNDKYYDEVSQLADKVKTLSLNLAINLARKKNEASELAVLEPEFTKLVNGSVKVVKEVAIILKAFKNEEKMVYSPSDTDRNLERIEGSLNEILKLSKVVLSSIAEIKDQKNNENKTNGWINTNPKEDR